MIAQLVGAGWWKWETLFRNGSRVWHEICLLQVFQFWGIFAHFILFFSFFFLHWYVVWVKSSGICLAILCNTSFFLNFWGRSKSWSGLSVGLEKHFFFLMMFLKTISIFREANYTWANWTHCWIPHRREKLILHGGGREGMEPQGLWSK